MKQFYLVFFITVSFLTTYAQQPDYTKKNLVPLPDTTKFIDSVPTKDGFSRKYLAISPILFDVDDNNTTRIKIMGETLVCVEGPMRNGLKTGLFTFYVIDSIDNKKRYKIWEQDFVSDKLNGQWKTFDLSGRLVRYFTFNNDSLHGMVKEYWIDGTVVGEQEFFNGSQNFHAKQFSREGVIEKEISIVNGVPHGIAKEYYPNGKLKEMSTFKNGELDGIRTYYYPTGRTWSEYEHRNGKTWTIVANYDEKGKKRDAGTLKNGNGTIKYYNDDGTLRETVLFKDGVEVN